MASPIRGLGKGLDSIFSENSEEDKGGLTMLRLQDITPRKGQPRKKFDTESLSQLADSITAHGIIEPIVVRKAAGGFYEIIAGERRWRAAKMAGLREVPVVILEADEQKTAELSLIENIQREDLDPVEEVRAMKTLMTTYHMTQEQMSQRVGKSRSAIANSLRLLELPDELLKALSDGSLTAGHARALLGLVRKSDMTKAAEEIIAKDLSVRAAEELVRRMNAPKPEIPAADPSPLAVDYTAELEKALRKKWSRKVKIHTTGKKKKLEIEFSDNNDLNALLTLIGADDLL